MLSRLVRRLIDGFPLCFITRGSPRCAMARSYRQSIKLMDRGRQKTISRLDLIELSIKNMKAKRTRTMITIGGMTIGIGAIVFLVSIGYGLQALVISRVARLDEMKQTDIAPQAGGVMKINDKTLEDLKEIPKVDEVLPLIAVVGRVSYQNSVSDVAVYGVTSSYLEQSAIKPVEGKIFNSNEQVSLPSPNGRVAGLATERQIVAKGNTIQAIDFNFEPETWVRVRESPATNAKLIGYTKRNLGTLPGEEVWGQAFPGATEGKVVNESESGEVLGRWVKASVPIWEMKPCDSRVVADCENNTYLVSRDSSGQQVQTTGFFAELNVQITPAVYAVPKVLGLSTTASESAVTAAETSVIDWVELASEAGIIKPPDTKTVELGAAAKKVAVVNRAFLKLMDIKEAEAVGKTFNVAFVTVGDMVDGQTEKIESADSQYKIVAVTPDEKTPVFYVPFIDLRSMGITNFSQAKVIAHSSEDLPKIRKQIESMGFATVSVADTVAQINSLFSTARTLLALLGMAALAVAALGMFNTLTVSLLERTREVGFLKAIGMKSSEVEELFLTESLIMGFFGGILGIILGLGLGKLLGFILSLFSIFKGMGYIDISQVPISFIVVVVILSLCVGILTGIYPSRRAKRISALNALRYE